jgi:hypothetical protein
LVTTQWLEWSHEGKAFVEQGFCATRIAARDALDTVRRAFVSGLRAAMPGGEGLDDEAYLNRFHEHATVAKLNDARVRVIRERAWHRSSCSSSAPRLRCNGT